MENGLAMKFIRSLLVAFSLYSRIPVPRFEPREEDMKYNLVFLPWVGALIGVAVYAITFLPQWQSLPNFAKTASLVLIPILATGGFHIDGYMDVQDALRSYKSREEKLAILKDPHIGAFSVITLATLGLAWLACLSTIVDALDKRYLFAYAASFYLSRCIGAILSYTLVHAKNKGMLARETASRDRSIIIALCVELAIGIGVLSVYPFFCAILMLVLCVDAFFYRRKIYREFGGTTGDAIGYYIVRTEFAILATSAFAYVWIGVAGK